MKRTFAKLLHAQTYLASMLFLWTLQGNCQPAYLNEIQHTFTSFSSKKSVQLPANDPEGGKFMFASTLEYDKIAITKVDDQGAPIWIRSYTAPSGVYAYWVADFIRFEYQDDYVYALLTYTISDYNAVDELWRPNLLFIKYDGSVIASYDLDIQDPSKSSMRLFEPKRLEWDQSEQKLIILGTLGNNALLAGHYGEDEDKNIALVSTDPQGSALDVALYDINQTFNEAVSLYIDDVDGGYWLLTNERSLSPHLWGSNVFKVDNSLTPLTPTSDIYPSGNFDLIKSHGWSYFEENNDRHFVVYGQLREPSTIGNYNMFLYTFKLEDALNCQGSCFNSDIDHFHVPNTLEEYIADGEFLSGKNPPLSYNGVEVNYQTVGANPDASGLDFHPSIYYFKVASGGVSAVGGFDFYNVTGMFFDILPEYGAVQIGNYYINRFIAGITKPNPSGLIHNPLILHRPDIFGGLIYDDCETHRPPQNYQYSAQMGSSNIDHLQADARIDKLKIIEQEEDKGANNLCKYPTLNSGEHGKAAGDNFTHQADVQVEIWPNPATDRQLNLRMQLLDDKQLTIKLYDATGRQVYQWQQSVRKNEPCQLSISTASMAEGMYFLKITDREITVWDQTVIIQ